MKVMFRKSIPSIILIMAMLFTACSPLAKPANIEEDAQKMQVTVSILPQKWFVDRIAGDLVITQNLVGSGDNPHIYEPTPSQMANLEKSVLYFTIGIEFEEAWMDKLIAANPTMKIVDSSAGIERIPMTGGHHHHTEDDADDHEDHDHATEDEDHEIDALDPHVWFSPDNAKQIAENIAKALIEQDPKNENIYANNLKALLEEIARTDKEITNLLKYVSRRHFMIVHPAWGYFAHAYDLHMIPVEIGGNEPGPADMAKILEAVEDYQISVLFVEKGSNMSLAQSIARQAGISEIIEWDPMAYEWAENMLSLGRDLQNALR
jgi:zinc transport system substrate-binding protein